MAKSGYKPIEDYGIIGDLNTVALVGIDGSIDWCCLPRFDAPSVFASILDRRKGGFFKIAPVRPATHKQMYLTDSCVLITRFLSPEGVGEIADFMPIGEHEGKRKRYHQIIRRVRVVRGTMRFRIDCAPAFDYARSKHTLKLTSKGAIFSSKKVCLGLTSPVKLKGSRGAAGTEFRLKAGEGVDFVLRHIERGDNKKLLDPAFEVEESFRRTIAFWQHWAAGCKYEGRWREMVLRSAMTLKLLTYAPTGAIVAAPTTSLPESLGGKRNWDYRYTWIRDAAFTVYGFIRLGLMKEAQAFIDWIDARAHEERKDGSLQIMYGIGGEHDLKEETLNHLEGYRGSKPVRIGNGAYDQLQLDIYGELMDSVYLANKYGKPVSYDLWTHLRRLLDYVCDNWHRKDEGIWEVRGGRQDFVYSKLMSWVALDRGGRLAAKRSFPGDRERWLKTRDRIYEEIMSKGWNPKRKAFVQHYGSNALDASNLLMPLTFFIAPNDPRMLSTLDATLKCLVSDSLVYRYNQGRAASDGMAGEEGPFSICTFWLVEALTRAGQVEKARLIFEKMLSYANHLGLYSEMIGK